MLFHIKWKFFQKFGFAIVLACTYFATGMYLALLIRIPAEFQSGDSTLWIMTLLFLYTRRRMQDFLLGNHSSLTEFILLGFSGNTKINVILFNLEISESINCVDGINKFCSYLNNLTIDLIDEIVNACIILLKCFLC